MRAMVFHGGRRQLELTDVPSPVPGQGQVLLRIHACAVCRTDLHIMDGELAEPKLPLIPGHEIVGTVVGHGPGADRFELGARLGVPWLGWTCGVCRYCCSGRENLCDQERFTGYTIDGGYAEFTVADERFCFAIPDSYSDVDAAPLLCAGLIGFRSLCKAGDAKSVGIYGFGAAAHIITQVARFQGREIYAFTRPGDQAGQAFALACGAAWAGDSDKPSPKTLDAAILFAPSGQLVPLALRAIAKGGVVVCGGIHMSNIPSFAYDLLWGERTISSVANLTRADGERFLALAPQVPVRTSVQTFPLDQANQALEKLRLGQVKGAAVLVM